MRAVDEHREPQALAGHFIAMRSWNPVDHAVQPQTAKIVGYFARPVHGGVEALQFGEMVTQVLVAKAIQVHSEQDQGRKQRLRSRVVEAKPRRALAVLFNRAHNLLIRVLANETVVGDGLNLQHASVGSKTNLPKLRQVL